MINNRRIALILAVTFMGVFASFILVTAFAFAQPVSVVQPLE